MMRQWLLPPSFSYPAGPSSQCISSCASSALSNAASNQRHKQCCEPPGDVVKAPHAYLGLRPAVVAAGAAQHRCSRPGAEPQSHAARGHAASPPAASFRRQTTCGGDEASRRQCGIALSDVLQWRRGG
eukprot:355086-Chlamydomonas_euryale.AAC.3